MVLIILVLFFIKWSTPSPVSNPLCELYCIGNKLNDGKRRTKRAVKGDKGTVRAQEERLAYGVEGEGQGTKILVSGRNTHMHTPCFSTSSFYMLKKKKVDSRFKMSLISFAKSCPIKLIVNFRLTAAAMTASTSVTSVSSSQLK